MITLNKHIPIFGGRLRTILYKKSELESLEKQYKFNDLSDCDAFTFKTEDKHSSRIYCMAFEIGEISHSTIAHESLHLSHEILKDIGHDASYENDEVQAYLLGYVVETVTRQILKNKQIIKS